MQNCDTQNSIELLVKCGPLKVWSLIVTILGDLCQSESDGISGKTLQALTGPMGVSDQAVRVALHRLRRNGWVESCKEGRQSIYSLSKTGWAETQAVRGRIYAEPTPSPVWLIIAPNAGYDFEKFAPDIIQLAPRSALLCCAASDLPTDVIATDLDGARFPDWAHDQIADEALCDDYRGLAECLKAFEPSTTPDLLETTIQRLLILHHWRRLRLRHGNLPDSLYGADWAGAVARSTTFDALEKLPRPTLGALEPAVLRAR